MKSNQPVNYICYHCQKQCTRGDPSLIRAAGRLYHKQCFQCDSCGVSVLDKFYLTNDMILCEKDYYRCRQCQQRITEESQLQEFGDYKYHAECLICPGCTIIPTPLNIPQPNYYDYNGRLYCQYHYSLIKGVECIGCGQAVFQQENHPEIEDIWHTECFMIYKYWQISLPPSQRNKQPNPALDSHFFFFLTLEHDYTDKQHYLFFQQQYALRRQKIWKTLCQFEQNSSTIIKNILISQLHSNCHQLIHHIHTLFQTLDYLHLLSLDHQQRKDPKGVVSKTLKDGLDFQYQKPVQLLMDQVVSFFHILGETQNKFEKEFMVKMAKLISQYIRELVRLSLQQALVLDKIGKQGEPSDGSSAASL
ncbi:hypothetical protein BY458DRAFT_106720 [Sporodiniella umbellata]|nr:hypothetical protein BY458DRAFT_106720 [Sporodiniella umbellata]